MGTASQAVHTGLHASKVEDASDLHLPCPWSQGHAYTYTDAGLVNRAMGTVQAICYQNGSPPSLLVAVIAKFDKYCRPNLHHGSVSIVPIVSDIL